jgi:hypothetical protein
MARITVDPQERTAPAKTERRNSPRIAVNGLAYVNLAPDNGGIVLNVSEEGLCFQSRAPVRSVDSIRFWFSYRSQRIDAGGGPASTSEPSRGGVSRFIEVASELAWTDDTRKKGGLRFKNLPEVARQQIRDWMHEPALVRVNERPTPTFHSAKKSYKSRAQIRLENLVERFRQIPIARLWTGYSGGLVNGIVLSAALVGLFSFLIHSHRLGDSLVQLGELLGGRSSHSTSTATPRESPSTLPTSATTPLEQQTVSAEPPAVATPIHDPLPEEPPTASPTVVNSREVRLEAEGPETPSISRSVARPSVPKIFLKPTAQPDESTLFASAPEVPLATPLAVRSQPSKVQGPFTGPEKYLEVGKFKEKPLADALVDRISRFDLPAKVSPSSRFFGKSYQVLVGPYGSDPEAEAAHKDLSSHGFTPRSYERGKRDFFLRPGLKVGPTRLPVGECVITWESYMPDSIVKFEDPRGASVTVEGKWVKRDDKYAENAIAFVKDRDGSLALLEIRFSGLRETLVFGRGPAR